LGKSEVMPMQKYHLQLFIVLALCVCFGVPSAIILMVLDEIERVKARRQARRILDSQELADFATVNQTINAMLNSARKKVGKSNKRIIEQLRQLRDEVKKEQ